MARPITLTDTPITLEVLEKHGLLHSFSTSARDGVERYHPDFHRWYFLEGNLYECIRENGRWTVHEIELTRTGRSWVS